LQILLTQRCASDEREYVDKIKVDNNKKPGKTCKMKLTKNEVNKNNASGVQGMYSGTHRESGDGLGPLKGSSASCHATAEPDPTHHHVHSNNRQLCHPPAL